MISILILTHNEEQDLHGCLNSVAWSDDVHVFDSFSTDATTIIAANFGAHLTQHAFHGYASQRNAALETLHFLHDWIFILDADERPSQTLCDEMLRSTAAAQPTTAAFKLRRRDFLYGTWLKHAQITPYYVRLVRRGRAHYVREINEVIEVDGIVSELSQPLHHYPFSKGIAHWLSKHNQYSSMEAGLIHRKQGIPHPSWSTAFFGRDFHTRRLHQKALFYRLPARPLIKWLYMVFIRAAFLDGRAGLTYATLQSIYEYMIVLKTRELEANSPN